MIKSSKQLLWIVPAVIVSVITVWLWQTTGNKQHAPDISFPLIDGREIPLSSLSGQPVLVTFWASTCMECLREMPHLIMLHRELSASGFEIIGVAMPYDQPDRVLATSRRMNIPYPVALDIDGNAVRAFGDVAATPASFLISPDGRIVRSHTGVMDIDQLRHDVISLISAESQVTGHKL